MRFILAEGGGRDRPEPADLERRLEARARGQRRSLSAQVLHDIEASLADEPMTRRSPTPG
jgi:hypothetical protein